MRIIFKLVLGILILAPLAITILWLRSDVEPVVWRPAPLPAMEGVYAPTDAFASIEKIEMPVGVIGPEDIAIGKDGWLYTGVRGGRILRFQTDRPEVIEEVANTGGRPLGMQFDASDNLIIADAVKGLLSLSPDGILRTLTDSVDGQRMLFVDDLDIAGDGTIWFSDASMRFPYPHVLKDFLEASATGRLLSYSPLTGKTTVHIRGLFFANGVALGPNDEFVLVNETGTSRIHRLWLSGERAGQRDVFHDGLPGNPDNLSFNGDDIFWVALVRIRIRENEQLASRTFLRKVIGGLHLEEIPDKSPATFVIGLSVDGAVRHVLLSRQDRFHSVTSVHQSGQRLFLGSLAMDSVGIAGVPGE